MTDSPFNWKVPAGRALEAALNRAIALDPETRAALGPLQGRSVELAVEAPPLALRLQVQGERLTVGPVDPGNEPDLGVRATLGGLLSQLPMLRRDDAPPVGRMRVSGDADLARRLQRLAERFDPDWQQPFVAVFGEIVGVQVARAVAAGLRHARDAGRDLAETTAEYVTEESRDVVGRAELDAFHDDVDTLRDDAARLAARIARLRQSLDERPGAAR
ncbi:SCP2 sterol-binding domain-containing protein [Luteimonas sp. 8-5]|uniref:ubiquinone biosynthesis accessory factor UbiJ n=1 Tax=Luteimonas sp. 8-5 TaxID=3039387 RepID=UPI0024368458|nr:SCP2 sterol-binding domain-containing protein [Luteimonas sp. 8-5]MDG6348772.1 SCP2 sterol-binding domain-containing protein [Luteimonas sp. 8-5]